MVSGLRHTCSTVAPVASQPRRAAPSAPPAVEENGALPPQPGKSIAGYREAGNTDLGEAPAVVVPTQAAHSRVDHFHGMTASDQAGGEAFQSHGHAIYVRRKSVSDNSQFHGAFQM